MEELTNKMFYPTMGSKALRGPVETKKMNNK